MFVSAQLPIHHRARNPSLLAFVALSLLPESVLFQHTQANNCFYKFLVRQAASTPSRLFSSSPPTDSDINIVVGIHHVIYCKPALLLVEEGIPRSRASPFFFHVLALVILISRVLFVPGRRDTVEPLPTRPFSFVTRHSQSHHFPCSV
jgi:hypothetical protein